MNELWKNIVVNKICAAVYVAPNTGKSIHKNRPSHGLVLNDPNAIMEIYFEDGRVIRPSGNSLFYLPKGSSYRVKDIHRGGCYAINFEADIVDEPFSISLRSTEHIQHCFKDACEAWKCREDTRSLIAMAALYDIVLQVSRELQRQYVTSTHVSLLSPAIEKIDQCFSENDLSVASLASLCGISEVYFRRLFLNLFGISPKEYMIQKRIGYAKSLLQSGSFSVVEVAELCGYSEPCHFSREFTKRVGVSPSKYDVK